MVQQGRVSRASFRFRTHASRRTAICAFPQIIKNFLIVPNFDFTLLPGNDNLWSAGADITAEMGKFIVPFDCSLGVSVSYLGGSAFDAVGQRDRWSVGLIMSYDF